MPDLHPKDAVYQHKTRCHVTHNVALNEKPGQGNRARLYVAVRGEQKKYSSFQKNQNAHG